MSLSHPAGGGRSSTATSGMRATKLTVAALVVVGAVALCPRPSARAATAQGTAGTVHVYSSLPLQGASRTQTASTVQGIRLALAEAGGTAGNYAIDYTSLDDSTAAAGNWDPGQTAKNARRVARDAQAVAYIGEFNSGASAISIPILNAAGIPQVSPSNTYPGLTRGGPGTERGEPDKYYPTGVRTYMRIVPNDTVEAAALVALLRRDRCRNVALADDGETYGAGLDRLIRLDAAKIGMHVVSDHVINATA